MSHVWRTWAAACLVAGLLAGCGGDDLSWCFGTGCPDPDEKALQRAP